MINMEFQKPLEMTEEEEDLFQGSDKCYNGGHKYLDNEIKVRDHYHISGKYRGSAHQECNLKLKLDASKLKVPVIFHNLRGYDSHFIMQQIGSIGKSNN